MFGLRTTKGIHQPAFLKASRGNKMEDVFNMNQVRLLEKEGFIACTWDKLALEHLSITLKGSILADSISSRLLK